MSTLSVLRFSSADGAQQMKDALLDLQKRQIIVVQDDAALVTWPEGSRSPQTQQLHSMAGANALAEDFWGILFGQIFFSFFGFSVNTANSAPGEKFSDYGIDEIFIEQARAAVTEGTSALFVLTSSAIQNKVVAALDCPSFEFISTNLPKEKEAKLRATFGTV